MRWTFRQRKQSDSGPSRPYVTASDLAQRSLSAPDLGLAADHDRADLQGLLVRVYLDQTHTGVSPPDYEALVPAWPRFPVFPREEEGAELLPGYSSAVFKAGLMLRKLELVRPLTMAPQKSRTWQLVHVELNNTQLNLYDVKCTRPSKATKSRPKQRYIEPVDPHEAFDPAMAYQKGALLRSYTLQYADIGLAVDYLKTGNVLRVRVEGEQFLLDSHSDEQCIDWVNKLQMGTDLALALEERTLPKYRSIPRSRRRRRAQVRDSVQVDRADKERRRLSLTRLMDAFSFDEGSKRRSVEASEVTEARRSVDVRRSVETRPEPRRHSVPNGALMAHSQTNQLEIFEMDNRMQINRLVLNPEPDSKAVTWTRDTDRLQDIEEDVDEYDVDDLVDAERLNATEDYSASKWRPQIHTPSDSHYIRYAQRCLAPLTARTPWKDKTFILDGQRFIVRESFYERVA